MSEKISHIVAGTYTADGVTCKESTLGGCVLRVTVNRMKKIAEMSSSEEPPKQVKRSIDELSSDEVEEVPLVRKRGRPRKIIKIVEGEDISGKTNPDKALSPRKRGRPGKAKYNFESNIKPLIDSTVYSVKPRLIINGRRIRKPSSRFSDFVVSSGSKRFRSTSSSDEPYSEESPVVKKRPKSPSSPMMHGKEVDPLGLPTDDEIVHSFLPFDSKKASAKNSNEKATDSPVKTTTKQTIAAKSADQSVVTSPKTLSVTTAKPRVYGKSTTKKFATSTPLKSKLSDKETSNSKLSEILEETVAALDISKPIESTNNKDVTSNLSQLASSNVEEASILKNELSKKPSYIVQIMQGRQQPINISSRHHDGKYMDFNRLVRSLKLVKLPGPKWKIRIVVSKQQTITEVTFTNKEENERCVKFARTINGYVLTIGKVVARLLGAPDHIQSFNDVSMLLDIIHTIELEDPILDYNRPPVDT